MNIILVLYICPDICFIILASSSINIIFMANGTMSQQTPQHMLPTHHF